MLLVNFIYFTYRWLNKIQYAGIIWLFKKIEFQSKILIFMNFDNNLTKVQICSAPKSGLLFWALLDLTLTLMLWKELFLYSKDLMLWKELFFVLLLFGIYIIYFDSSVCEQLSVCDLIFWSLQPFLPILYQLEKKTESVNSYNLRVSEEFKIDRSVKYYKIYYKCSHSLPLADRKGCENKSKKILEAFFQIVHLTYQLDIIDLENALILIING